MPVSQTVLIRSRDHPVFAYDRQRDYSIPAIVAAATFCSRQAGKILANLQVMKTSIRLVLTLLTFLCLAAVGPKARAVVPAPDGGYPGGNTAEGQNALLSLTIGGFNTAVGYLSLRSNTNTSFNTAVGAGTLLASTAHENTAVDAGALLSTITGSPNT